MNRRARLVSGLRSQRGAALLLVLAVLAVLAALVGGAFAISLHEQRIGRGAAAQVRALQAAESGNALVMANWDARVYAGISIGSWVSFANWLPDSIGWYRGSVRRMTETIYFVMSEGFSRDSLARQRVGVLARLVSLEIAPEAALRTQGGLTVENAATVSGVDRIPPGWDSCPPVSDTLAGVQTNDGQVTTVAAGAVVEGTPAIVEDRSLDSATLTQFGGTTFGGLRRYASRILPSQAYTGSVAPTASGGVCDELAVTNWGEPGGAVPECTDYFPVIYVDGDATIGGGRGQGVLVVNGSLKIEKGFLWAGLVLVRQTLAMAGTALQPSTIMGWAAAANVNQDLQVLNTHSRIQFSSCAVRRSLLTTAVARPFKVRSWALLY